MPIPQSVVNTNESAPRFSIQQNVAQNPSRKLRAQKSQVHGLADCDTKGKST